MYKRQTLLHAPSLTAKGVIGLDKTCALEMVQAGGVTTDYDKLIDRCLLYTSRCV